MTISHNSSASRMQDSDVTAQPAAPGAAVDAASGVEAAAGSSAEIIIFPRTYPRSEFTPQQAGSAMLDEFDAIRRLMFGTSSDVQGFAAGGRVPAEYVTTDEIRRAVEGHEEEILRALGIAWNGGGSGIRHINCPYPSHDDTNPSWRWDAVGRVAHCTCSTPSAHSIFDAIMNKQVVDFDRAKIFAAEAIGRTDLIHGRSRNGEGKMNGSASGAAHVRDTKAAEPPPVTMTRDDPFPHRIAMAGPFPPRTLPDDKGKPWFVVAGEEGPRARPDEIRRHVYRRDGVPVRIKVKYTTKEGGTAFANWYRVVDVDGRTGWQAGMPKGFVDVPYITFGSNPFDQEARGSRLYWTEGEKDVNSVTKVGALAFTFGGVGDGLPGWDVKSGKFVDAAAEAVWRGIFEGQFIIILPDNDDKGRKHAQDKAAVAKMAGATSIGVLDLADSFPGLQAKGDVSDLIEQGLTLERLEELADAAPEWEPQRARQEKREGPRSGASNDDGRSEYFTLQAWLIENTHYRHRKHEIAGRSPETLRRIAVTYGYGKIEENVSDEEDLESDDRAGFSDDALALRLLDEHAHDLRYLEEQKSWLQWDGSRWSYVKTLNVYDIARDLLRRAASETKDAKKQEDVRANKTVNAVTHLARTDRRVALVVDDLDRDLWLLNTPGGTVNLRTGALQEHSRRDHITKVTGATPGGNCPRFLTFLYRIMGYTDGENLEADDSADELVKYIQRMLGYGLTGVTTEHAMFFAYGTGANGKSVLLGTVAGIMGDYHTTAPIETFIASNSDRHPTDLAGLRGARLVTAIETEKGRYWNETKLKSITGGDRIKARFMRQDFFEFIPVFKLLIGGNDKPSLKSTDEAIKRRLNMLPFSVTIPEGERNKQLTEELKDEWPGILQWMIEGCLEWQRIGLVPPKAVLEATAKYFEDQDVLSDWIAEACDAEENKYTGVGCKSESVGALYESWCAYAKRHGREPGGKTTFGDMMEGKSFPRGKDALGNRIIKGIRLRYKNTGHNSDDNDGAP